MATNIFADMTNARLVASIKGGSALTLVAPKHQDILNWTIQPLDYDSSGAASSSPFTVLDASGYTVSLLVTKASDGSTLAGPFTTWTPSGTALTGSADLYSVAMDAAFSGLNAGDTVSTIFWLQISNGTTRKVTIQIPLSVVKSAITSGTPSAIAGVRYPTFEDLASYVKYSGNPNGATITLPSPDGSNSLVLGANNDTSAAANTQT